HVCENMMANGYSLGGEQSGHIIFSKHASTGVGVLTSLMVIEVMLEKKTSLHTLAKEITIYPQWLKNVKVADKKAAKENSAVKKTIAEVKQSPGGEGRILVRESGTEPVIRVMVEAAEDALCETCVDQVIEVMRQENLIISD